MVSKQPPKRRTFQTLIIWSLILVAVYIIIWQVISRSTKAVDIPYSIFLRELRSNNVHEVTMTERSIKGKFRSSIAFEEEDSFTDFSTLIPFDDPKLAEELVQYNVKVVAKQKSSWGNILIGIVPWLLLIGVWIFFIRQMQSGQNRALGFGRSRAKVILENKPSVTFADVAGVEEAKQELTEVIEFLKEPRKFTRLGGRIPKGVLVVGPPGCGKTLLAKAVAGEAGVPFFSISGSDFVELFVGVGASRVRDLFEQAKKAAKVSAKGCIILIDEIDAVGRQRFAGIGGGHDEREQTLNQLLAEMDGFQTEEGIVLMAATNRPDVLDPALLRPGRFDRHVVVDAPDIKGREAILKVHSRKLKLADDADLTVIAKQTPGFSGADLENLCNEAALLAARRDKQGVGLEELQEAMERVVAGPQRKSRVISKKEKEITAYHESGHALLHLYLPNVDPLHKVSIIPRGMGALGYTMPLPTQDRYTHTKSELLDRICSYLGGMAAEEIVFGEVTTGAYNDLEMATKIARKMVTEFGMSDKIGHRSLGKREGPVFLGRDLVEHKDYSEEVARVVDSEITRLVEDAYVRAKDILQSNIDQLKLVAQRLLEKEVMDAQEVKELIGFKDANNASADSD